MTTHQHMGTTMTQSTDFTPGPWSVTGATLVYAGSKGTVCAMSKIRASGIVEYIPVTPSDPDFAEACANASLIAAAPELLATLERAPEPVKFEQDREGLRAFVRAYQEWVPQLYTALAKARGEQVSA